MLIMLPNGKHVETSNYAAIPKHGHYKKEANKGKIRRGGISGGCSAQARLT